MADAIGKIQKRHDALYAQHGPCCAGCDWWRHFNSAVGECTKSAPMPGTDRLAMIGISGCSLNPGAGHVMTRATHHCGDFKDDFDWAGNGGAYG